MLRPRLIPCLLVQQGRLVKTQQFASPKYVGDPLNAVRIFNEKGVDELMVCDIDATHRGTEPNYTLVESLAAQCRMPLAYGGGVRSVEQAARIIQSGVEKVALSAAAVERPALVRELAQFVGRQSVVVVLDVRAVGAGWQVFTHNGSRATGHSVVEAARALAGEGAGELVINSIDRDGMMQGYDLPLMEAVRSAVEVPITALGGAGKLADFEALYTRCGRIGAAAGSAFVFKGVHRAVLISYPSRAQRQGLALAAQGSPSMSGAGV